MLATNAPNSSSLDVVDYAEVIIPKLEESFVSGLGNVHAEEASLEDAVILNVTEFVNSFDLITRRCLMVFQLQKPN